MSNSGCSLCQFSTVICLGAKLCTYYLLLWLSYSKHLQASIDLLLKKLWW
uniref:Uncharacterized protein n=1 Tax=Arundo donax TaxID=35708 RepID=A0A0A8YV89_ARUDO